jgi:hypothetical protein
MELKLKAKEDRPNNAGVGIAESPKSKFISIREGCGDKIWECTIKQFLKPKVPIGFCGTPVFINGIPYCHREYLVKTCVTYTECEHKEWVICGL